MNVAIPVKVEVLLAVKTPPEVRVPVVDRVPGAIMVLERLAVMVSVPDEVSSTSFAVEVKLTTVEVPVLGVRVITAVAPPEAGSVYVVSPVSAGRVTVFKLRAVT